MTNYKTKVCSICKEELPNTPKYFHRNSMCKDGLTPRCKVCENSIRNGSFLIVEHPVPTKDRYTFCTKCHNLKSNEKFYVNKTSLGGHIHICKDCIKKRYYENKGLVLKRVREYKKTEKGKVTIRKHRSKRRGYGYIEMFSNPFNENEEVDWHHIGDNAYVVAIPKDLHQLYCGKYHKEMCMNVVKQIYLW